MKSTVQDREFDKFRPADNDKSKIAVTTDSDDPLKVDISGISWDSILVSFPQLDQEVYTYSLNLVTVQTVTVTYTDSTKKFIQSIIKVKS